MTDERRADESYDLSAFQILADESPGDDPKVANGKIRRFLRRKNLGDYDESRIAALRRLRDELQTEIRRFEKSSYFLGKDRHITEHFDFERMASDFAKKYPTVQQPDIRGVVGYALYYYYFR
jgi:hypothetical protein